jgi:DNA mismatch repair protein MSH5
VQTHEIGRLLDEAMSEDDVRELQAAEEVCRRFLAVDLLSEDGKADVLASGVKGVLEGVLGLVNELDSEPEPEP